MSPSQTDDSPALRPLDVAALPSLGDFGFRGGRLNFVEFCRSVFASDQPRFLRTPDNNLVVLRHADLRAMAVLPALGNVPSGVLQARVRAGAASTGYDGKIRDRMVGEAMADVFANQFFFNNEPIHTPLRRMMLTQIGPKAVPQMVELAQSTLRGILEETPRDQVIDFARDVAEKLTVRFWGELIGLSPEEKIALGALLRAMNPAFSLARDPEGFRRMDDAFAAYEGIIERAALRSVAQGDRPMVQALAAELDKLDLADDPDCAGIVPPNAGTMLAGVLTDGFHTAAVAAVNAVHVLVRRPQALAQVRANPELWPAAIAEAFRTQPPVLMLNRFTLSEVAYDGWLIPKGITVVMMWGAGNQDPSAFPSPETFDLGRSALGHTTFGGGAQICPGRHAVGMLARTLLEGLEAADLEVVPAAEDDEWIDHHIMSQLQAFPVRLQHRGGARVAS